MKQKRDSALLKTMQKNRFSKQFKQHSFKFGTIGIKFVHEGLLEFKHALMFKRILKKMVKKKKRKMTRK
jgi:hypothetical protein